MALILLEDSFEPCIYSTRLYKKLRLASFPISTFDFQRIDKAIGFVRYFYRKQRRISGELYYSQALEVAAKMVDIGGNLNGVLLSILHRILEKTNLTYEILEMEFGPLVAEEILQLSQLTSCGEISNSDMLHRLWVSRDYQLLLVKFCEAITLLESLEFLSAAHKKNFIIQVLQYSSAASSIVKTSKLDTFMYRYFLMGSKSNYSQSLFISPSKKY
jgi:(p)ppGpp synthase/HD superfamily hydrolase